MSQEPDTTRPAEEPVLLEDHDPAWRARYQAERARLLEAVAGRVEAIEHIGSTAIPDLRAKPIIDMMAAVDRLEDMEAARGALEALGYEVVDAGMPRRLFFRKRVPDGRTAFHLHVVETCTWHERNERLFRDYLLAHPEAVDLYAEAKQRAAATHASDRLAYTKAKTPCVQSIVDRARRERGLPLVDVWEG